MKYQYFLFAMVLVPFAAYALYIGLKLYRVSRTEYLNLAKLQSPKGFVNGYVDFYADTGHGDYRIRRGLEVSKDGKVILEQGAISTNALKTAYPH